METLGYKSVRVVVTKTLTGGAAYSLRHVVFKDKAQTMVHWISPKDVCLSASSKRELLNLIEEYVDAFDKPFVAGLV